METYFIMYIMASGVFCADQIGPNQNQDTEVFHSEGQSVTMECSYDSSSQDIYIYWYKQYPTTAPQYLLRKGARSNSYEHISDSRFSSATSPTSTQFTIRGLTLADTALYYCALLYGMEYNPELTFGKPIKLTVIPGDKPNTLPSLSILLPSGSSGGSKVCLAAGYSPNTGKMELTVAGESNPVQKDVSTATLSKDGFYYYAGFSESDIKKCTFQGVDAMKESKGGSPEPKCEPTATETNKNSNQTIQNNGDTKGPNGNVTNVLMTSLRLLLAKAVAINVMMSIKAFLV